MSAADAAATEAPNNKRPHVDVDADYLIPYASSGQTFVPYNASDPRGLPFPAGAWNGQRFVTVSEDRNSVTFKMQAGTYLAAGHNGVYVDSLIQFALAQVQALNTGPLACREYSMVVTDLENALLHLLRRQVSRQVEGTHGAGAAAAAAPKQ
jgi:hypothetical protein